MSSLRVPQYGARTAAPIGVEKKTGGKDATADTDDVDEAVDRGDLPGQVDRGLHADEVEHRRRPETVRQLTDALGGVRVGGHRVVRADLAGEGELVLAEVDRDDRDLRDGPQDLHADVSEAADADHDSRRTGVQLLLRRNDRVVRRESGVRQRHRLDRIEVAERNEVARVIDDHVLGHRAGAAETGRGDAHLGGMGAVVLRTLRARVAATAAPRAVDGVRGTDLHALDTFAELVDDAGALVSEGQGQAVGVLLLRQVHHEPVRVAQARRGHLQTYLAGAGVGFFDLDDLGSLADLAVLHSLHGIPFCRGVGASTVPASSRVADGG